MPDRGAPLIVAIVGAAGFALGVRFIREDVAPSEFIVFLLINATAVLFAVAATAFGVFK